MKWENIGGQTCSVARTLSVIGDRWTLWVLRCAFLGARRFDDFQAESGISRHLLSERLSRLVDEGIFRKNLYNEHPPRYEYRFTQKGMELYPVMYALLGWGDKYKAEETGPPVLLQHKTCGHVNTPHMVCSHCGEPSPPDSLNLLPGPGLKKVKSAD